LAARGRISHNFVSFINIDPALLKKMAYPKKFG
jgi:hypothetical protein